MRNSADCLHVQRISILYQFLLFLQRNIATLIKTTHFSYSPTCRCYNTEGLKWPEVLDIYLPSILFSPSIFTMMNSFADGIRYKVASLVVQIRLPFSWRLALALTSSFYQNCNMSITTCCTIKLFSMELWIGSWFTINSTTLIWKSIFTKVDKLENDDENA